MNVLIIGAHVLTMDKFKEFNPGAVFIGDKKIKAVGPADQIKKQYLNDADEIIDTTNQLLIPGLIDSHEHAGADRLAEAFNLEIGISTLLRKYKWPLLSEVSPSQIRLGAELAYAEAIRNGVTCTIMNYYAGRGINQDGVPEAAKEYGVKTVLARGYHDLPGQVPDALLESGDQVFRVYKELIRKWHNQCEGRIHVAISPVNLAFNLPENLGPLADLARQHKIGFHTHLAEVESQVKEFKRRTGHSMVELLYGIGALGPKSQAAQGIYLSDKDVELLAKTGTSVVHCPTSNMFATKGVCPIGRLKNAKVNLALGSDTVETMLSTLRQAAYLRKIITMDATSYTARESLFFATIGGAKAINLESSIGKIAAGYSADLTLMDPRSVDTVPYLDPYNFVAYRSRPEHVKTVIIDGRTVLRDGKFVSIDEKTLLKKAEKLKETLYTRYYP
ncbi:MAG: amidohydrolase family protein [Candidatus Ranarchaeia archaeon]